jgi:ribosomal protein L40E
MSSNAFAQSEREYNEAIEHREQAAMERMHTETLCWNCNAVYPKDAATCPSCGRINANVDLDGAIKQQEEV